MRGTVCLLAVLALSACQDDAWTYRPRDAGAVLDVSRADGGGPGDGGAPDAVVAPDGASDAAVGADVPVDGDGGVVTPDAVSPDGSSTGLALRAIGFVTTGAEPQRTGTLRLSETGFEFSERTCVGTLCSVAGFLP